MRVQTESQKLQPLTAAVHLVESHQHGEAAKKIDRTTSTKTIVY